MAQTQRVASVTPIQDRGYVHPEVLVSTQWVADHLDDPRVRLLESNEDLLLYDTGHIPGAVSLPMGEFDMHIEAFMNRHSPEQPIVTYCSGRTCEDSHELAQLFLASGFLNVSVFIDGFPGWEAQGYPIE